jgi:hypothetical protein
VPVKASAAGEIEIDRASTQKAAKDTKTNQELGSCHDPALPKEWGPRNTRKGMRGIDWEAHVTSRDPTLDAGRALSSPHSTTPCGCGFADTPTPRPFVVAAMPRCGLLCKFSLLSSVRARFRSGGLHKEVIMPGASITSSTIPARRASQRSVRSNGRTANVVGACRNHGRLLNRGAVPPVFRPQSIAGKS